MENEIKFIIPKDPVMLKDTPIESTSETFSFVNFIESQNTKEVLNNDR